MQDVLKQAQELFCFRIAISLEESLENVTLTLLRDCQRDTS